MVISHCQENFVPCCSQSHATRLHSATVSRHSPKHVVPTYSADGGRAAVQIAGQNQLQNRSYSRLFAHTQAFPPPTPLVQFIPCIWPWSHVIHWDEGEVLWVYWLLHSTCMCTRKNQQPSISKSCLKVSERGIQILVQKCAAFWRVQNFEMRCWKHLRTLEKSAF